jgi:hypothetical protein
VYPKVEIHKKNLFVNKNFETMKIKRIIHTLSLVLATSFFFVSCQKDNVKTGLTEEDVAKAEDDALTEAVFDDIMNSVDNAVNIVDKLIWGSGLKSATVSDTCPSITVDFPDSTWWPKVITIDYGDTECEGFYGQTRKGKIIITITNRYRVPGSEREVTLDNYYINGIHVEGTKTVTNEGRNENDNLTFTVELVGGGITTPNGIVITRDFSRTREWVAGENTWENIWDDVYFITGSANGTNFKGESYTRTILSALEWATSCRFVKSGSIEIVVGDKSPIVIDYGDGECDNIATVTKDGETREILLKLKHRNKIN